VNKGEFGVGHLPRIRFTPQLSYRFDNMEHAAGGTGVTKRQQAAMGVAGQPSAMGQLAL
jgi:hypothetical protein